MSAAGLLAATAGVAIASLGIFGLRRSRDPLDPRPGVSLIEFAMMKLDVAEPLSEQPWERKLDRLLCWVGIFAGAGFVLVGLNYLN